MNISSYNKNAMRKRNQACEGKPLNKLNLRAKRAEVKPLNKLNLRAKRAEGKPLNKLKLRAKTGKYKNKEHFRFFLRKAGNRVRNKDAKKDSANQSLNPFFLLLTNKTFHFFQM